MLTCGKKAVHSGECHFLCQSQMVISSQDIIKIVRDRLDENNSDRRLDISIAGSTRLVGDLGFSSVEFVVIFEKIQQILPERINFIDLIMPDRSSYVDDLSIDQIVSFLVPSDSRSEASALADPYVDKREPITQSDIDLLNRFIQHQDYLDEQVTTTTQLCFLLSAPRSGSTLLRRMLGCHPDVYAPMELHLMSYQDFSQRSQELSDEDHAHLLEGTIVARQEVRGMTRAISMAIDQMYARDRRPVSQFFKELDPYIQTKVLVDKTPTYAFSLSTLERIKKVFPDAKFIHLTRRPNAVIKSMIDSDLGQIIRFMQTSGIQPNRFAEALWCLCEQNIRAALKDVGAHAIRVDYESLVTMPEQTIGRLHDFLGIPPSQSFNPYTQQDNISKEKVDSFAGDLKTYLRNSIDSSVASEWQSFRSLNWLSEPTSSLLKNS
jgi:LPS sulfotransferase NodH